MKKRAEFRGTSRNLAERACEVRDPERGRGGVFRERFDGQKTKDSPAAGTADKSRLIIKLLGKINLIIG